MSSATETTAARKEAYKLCKLRWGEPFLYECNVFISLRAVFLHICKDGLLELYYWSIPDSGVLSSRTSFKLFYPISLSSRKGFTFLKGSW